MKALDLRLELRRAESDLRASVEELPGLIQHAKNSRIAVASATGRLRSGAMEVWKGQWEADQKEISVLRDTLSQPNDDLAKTTNHDELESRLVAVHALVSRARRVREKLREELAKDDKEREQIRADARARSRSS